MPLSRSTESSFRSISRALSPDQDQTDMSDELPMTLGRKGYEAFRAKHDAGRDFPSPNWANVPQLVRDSWEAAGEAMAADAVGDESQADAVKPESKPESKPAQSASPATAKKPAKTSK